MKNYAYGWMTAAFFLVAICGHWIFGWLAFVNEQHDHGEAVRSGAYFVEMMRDTLENWQSEFLQLIWQVVGLAYFLYIGSPSSKENDDRAEAKLDLLLRMVGGEKAEALIAQIDERYLRAAGHALPHADGEERLSPPR